MSRNSSEAYIKKTKQVLFIHSGGSQGPHEGSHDLVDYLRKMLGTDYEVLYPRMPEPDNPGYEEWKSRLTGELALLEDGLILVGHSLGGSVLLKYLSEETCMREIAGLFIVASPYWGKKDWQVNEYVLRRNFARKLPYIPRIFLYHSVKDQVVPFLHLAFYADQLPNATVRAFDSREHLFSKGLPELVEDIKKVR